MAKYDPLRDHLRRQTTTAAMTFDEIADLVGGLPPSAHRHLAWWTNDDATHPQSKSWGDAGFTAHPDLRARVVTFERSR
jgi:hypothetical protein